MSIEILNRLRVDGNEIVINSFDDLFESIGYYDSDELYEALFDNVEDSYEWAMKHIGCAYAYKEDGPDDGTAVILSDSTPPLMLLHRLFERFSVDCSDLIFEVKYEGELDTFFGVLVLKMDDMGNVSYVDIRNAYPEVDYDSEDYDEFREMEKISLWQNDLIREAYDMLSQGKGTLIGGQYETT